MSEGTFIEYQLDASIIEALSLLGYEKPTPIQMQAIPEILRGRDIVGKSQTGSGKTAAFGIPICDKIIWEENLPQALILEPTRELAVQVKDELFQIGRKKRIKIPVVFGGMPIDKELISLKQKAHIVVGTPGRIMDHIRRESLNLSQIKYLVIDEADLMLDMGFIDEVEAIIKEVESQGSIVEKSLFSATIGDSLVTLIDRYMNDPAIIEVESPTETVQGVTQFGYQVENEDKFSLLMKLLMSENPGECMIFCGTREMVNALYQQLKRKRVRCGMLHGGMDQKDRLYGISDFRQGKFHYFITTDVAARGIDFPDITHVINYDFPTNRENYVHRIGRTARNGKTGKAISFIQKSEDRMKKAVEEYAGITIIMLEAPSREEAEEGKAEFFYKQKEKVVLKEGKGAVFHKTIMKLTIGGGRKSKLRASDIVGTLCSIPGMTVADIGIIDIRDSLTYVEIFNGKGENVLEILQAKPIKGKVRKVQRARNQ